MDRESKPRDAAFIEALYEKYRGLMFSTAYRYGGEEDAEVVVNEAILRLARHVDTLRRLNEAALAVYVACTIQSVALNINRRRGTERRHTAERELSELTDLSAGPGPEEQFLEREARAERLRLLREALAELKEADREILSEKYFANASDAALAAKYGISESGVRVRVSRARKRARALLERKEGGHDKKKR